MVGNGLCHIPTLHHYNRFPPGGNVTGGNKLGNHGDYDDDVDDDDVDVDNYNDDDVDDYNDDDDCDDEGDDKIKLGSPNCSQDLHLRLM